MNMANSYSDGIKVKISEKYKPPCRISLPMSYSQRLTLNKQLQDSRPSYDFQLETTVLQKMKEWKDIRRELAEERKQRLDLAREEFDKKIEKEKTEKLAEEQAKAKALESGNINTNPEIKTQNLYSNVAGPRLTQQDYTSHGTPSQSQVNYVSKNGILMPIPVTNYSGNANNILKPAGAFQPPQSVAKAFNLSDFESDTSSPFDNMELKTINDLEELAQVLKSDRTNFQPIMYPNTTIYQGPVNYSTSSSATKSYGNLPVGTKGYGNFPQAHSDHASVAYGQNVSIPQDLGLYSQSSGVTANSQNYNQINSSFSQVSTSYNPISTTYSQYNNPYASPSSYQVPSGVSTYNNPMNGYLYNVPPQMTSQIQLNNSYAPYGANVPQLSMQKSNCKSVPDLVKSLERELDSTRLNDTTETSRHSISSSVYTTTNVPVPRRPKSTDSVYPKGKVKDPNPLDKLSQEQKEICQKVSLMGFPLDRVVRVCEAIGGDQKKIVDHLLALSDLLDLGFSERDASEALMKNNNDRDKALDLLIS